MTARPDGAFNAKENCEMQNEKINLDELRGDQVVIKVEAIGIDAFIRVMLDEKEEHGEKNKVHGGI